MDELIAFTYTIVPITDLVKEWVHPEGLTHVLYVSGPGIFDKKAIACYFSYDAATQGRDALMTQQLLDAIGVNHA